MILASELSLDAVLLRIVELAVDLNRRALRSPRRADAGLVLETSVARRAV